MRSPATTPRPSHAAAPLLHLLLALALMVQALAAAATAAAGTMHRHAPAMADLHAAPLQVLVDFRRTQDLAQAVAHAQPARHHHGASVADAVRTAEDQAADRGNDVADGLSAQLALLPPASPSPLPAATPPRVARSSWTVTMHQPALPERPPRQRAPRSADA